MPAIIALAALLLARPGPAQVASPTVPPSPADAMEAFRAVDGWAREWAAPADPQPIDPERTAGASVTLRLAGAVIGRGTDLAGDGLSVWRAATAAIAEARERAPVERDALREEGLRDAAERLTVDLQLAGALTPLLGDTFAAAGLAVPPGLRGVAARAGDRTESLFPGAMLMTGVTPDAGLRAACSALGLPLEELSALRAEHGAIVYAFRVTHLAQTGPREAPVFLHRGSRVVRPQDVSTASLRRFADRAAGAMLARRWPRAEEPLGMLGDYHPAQDRYDPLLAPPAAQAMAAAALFRYARSPWVAPADGARAARFAWSVLDDLATLADGEEDPRASAAACAWIVLARAFAPDRPPGMAPSAALDALADDAARRVLAARAESGQWEDGLREPERALAAWAMAAAARAGLPGADAQRARDAVHALFVETSAGDLVALMPWLGWADEAIDGEPAHADALAGMRDLVWRHQVSFMDAGEEEPDLVGGVVFTRGRSPLPTAQSLRPLAYLAGSPRRPALTDPSDATRETARVILGARFLLQLAADDASMHMFRDRERALGGVRDTPWSQRMSLEATALGLLTALEALETLDALRRPAPGTARETAPAPAATGGPATPR